jgi:3-oxoadipate enol-lactonase
MPMIKANDGAGIYYKVEGRRDGPPILFSNSLGSNLAMWDLQAAEAAGLGFRVIRYDQRGHGQSDAPPGEYSLERLGQDVFDLLDALKLERVAFCGLSMGAMTALWLAVNRRRRFERMALCNCAPIMPPRENWDTRIKTVTQSGMAAIADMIVERWFSAGFRAKKPKDVAAIKEMLLATDPVGYCGCCAAIRDMDLRRRLGLIEIPTLVVIGAHDPATVPAQGDYLVAQIPGAQKVVLDAAHISNIEQPDAFNAAVFGFLVGDRR